MSVAIAIPQLQHLPDVNVAPGASVDGYALVYDNASSRFVLPFISTGLRVTPDAAPAFTVPAGHTAIYANLEIAPSVTVNVAGTLINCKPYRNESIRLLNIGDSKTEHTAYSGNTWPALLAAQLTASTLTTETYALHETKSWGIGGWTAALMKASIAAKIAEVTERADLITINLGANDIGLGLPDETTWKNDMRTILNALRSKWPECLIYCARVWRRGYAASCNTLAGWLDTVIAEYSRVFVGMDERVWLENGDDGVALTYEGLHYNVAGETAAATAWRIGILGA